MNKEKKTALIRYLKYLGQYTLLFSIVAFGVFIWFGLESKTLIWRTDASSQYVPKAVYYINWLHDFIENLFHGKFKFIMYDFTIGMGDAVTLHMEPVYWLYALFQPEQIEFAYQFLIILRFYLAGLAMSVFTLYLGMESWPSLLSSVVYVFAGFGLYGGMRHSHFIIPMIMLPLLLIGMEEIYRKGKWYVCTITVALSLWCGYYFTYMNTIFMGIYFLIRFFGGSQKKSVREFFLRFRTIVCSYLLGVGISNITLFNTFASYLTSARSSSNTEKYNLWMYKTTWCPEFFQSFLTTSMSPGFWMFLGFTPLSYLCVALLFARRKNWQLKSGLIIATIFGIVPVFGYILCGFGTLNNRWCYAYALLIAWITAKMLPELVNLKKKDLIAIFIFMIPYLFIGIGRKMLHKDVPGSVLISSILLLGFYILILVFHIYKKVPKRICYSVITVCAVFFLWISGMYRFHENFAGMIDEFVVKGNVWNQATNNDLAAANQIDDSDFYRVAATENPKFAQGSSQMLGYNGIVYYSSTITNSIIDFYRKLGLTSWSLVRLTGFDDIPYLDALASVKYQLVNQDSPKDVPYGFEKVDTLQLNEKQFDLYQNHYVLPIGYSYDKVMTMDEFEKTDVIDRPEIMTQVAVVDNHDAGDYNTLNAEDVITSSQRVPITKIECDENLEFDGKEIKVNKKNAVMTIWFDGLDNCNTYLYLDQYRMNNDKDFYMDIDSDKGNHPISYRMYGRKDAYYTGQEQYVFNLGYTEEGKTYCTIKFNEKHTLNVDDIAIYCQPMDRLADDIAALKKDSMTDAVFEDNTITGSVSFSEDKMLVLSIPYQSGWTAYVDGIKTPVKQVNYMYMGLDLSRGDHTIELRFEIPGIRLSIMITLMAVILFVIALRVRKKRRMQENDIH